MAAATARTAIHPLVEKGKVLRTKGAALGGLPAPSTSTRSRDGEPARDAASNTMDEPVSGQAPRRRSAVREMSRFFGLAREHVCNLLQERNNLIGVESRHLSLDS